MESDDQIAKISIVGVGMRNHSGVAARMFEVLGKEGINIQMISTSEIKVSCVVQPSTPSSRCGRCTPPSGWTGQRHCRGAVNGGRTAALAVAVLGALGLGAWNQASLAGSRGRH